MIEQQALAFQSNPSWHSQSHACWHFNDVSDWLLEHLHKERYIRASQSLEELLILADGDDEGECATDIPGLDPCRSVKPIAYTPIFPPLWRMQAYRTILPEKLPEQLSKWKEWIKQISDGEHFAYVRRLHMFHDSDFARYHWGVLRGAADGYNKETKDPVLDKVRFEILTLPEPRVWPVPIEMTARERYQPASVDTEKDTENYPRMIAEIKRLIDLTKAWNSHVPKKWKVPEYGYDGDYYPSLEEFKYKVIEDDWFQRFFVWVEQCVQHGFGLFLHY